MNILTGQGLWRLQRLDHIHGNAYALVLVAASKSE